MVLLSALRDFPLRRQQRVDSSRNMSYVRLKNMAYAVSVVSGNNMLFREGPHLPCSKHNRYYNFIQNEKIAELRVRVLSEFVVYECQSQMVRGAYSTPTIRATV